MTREKKKVKKEPQVPNIAINKILKRRKKGTSTPRTCTGNGIPRIQICPLESDVKAIANHSANGEDCIEKIEVILRIFTNSNKI